MSDVMLLGVLRMPLEMAMSDELSRLQFHQRAQQAADRIEADADEIERLQAENARLREDAAIGAILVAGGFVDRMGDICEQDPAERIVADLMKKIDPILQARWERRIVAARATSSAQTAPEQAE
jgi:hypothetical protein